MKLSENTIKILKNYATINTNARFEAGNTLRVLSSAKDIFSVAKIEEEIPRAFSVYNLNLLLSQLYITGEPAEIEFDEKNLILDNGFNKIRFFYTSDDMFEHPPLKEVVLTPVYSFELPEAHLNFIQKTASTVVAPTLSISCDGKEVSLKNYDRRNDTAGDATRIVGEFDQEFNVYVNVENLKLIQTDYTVTIGKNSSGKSTVVNFKAKNQEIEYWIATGV